jgi:preprotein translocase subunit SecD
MKRIIYFLLSSVIYFTLSFGTIFSQNNSKIILLKPVSNSVNPVALTQSATIISARLKVYGIEKPDVIALTDKSQIKVQIPDNYTLSEIEGLLTMKGDLAFYETYNRKEVSELLKGDNQLFRLLNSDPEITPLDARIGCIKAENRSQIDAYLKGIKNPDNCKFFWHYIGLSSDESMRCLFAVKTNSEGKPLLGRSDIETAKAEPAKDGKSFNIAITFKKSAIGLWADATRKNMNRSIAITLDSYVYSYPTVRSVIDKGESEINGDMTLKDVNYLLALVNNEPLQIKLELVK